MSGSLFSAAATLLIGLLALLVIGAGFIWIIPIALLAVIPILGGTLFSKVRSSSLAQDEPSGVPSTSEASYTPQVDPGDR